MADRRGRLTRDQIICTMPAVSELYPTSPIEYRGTEAIAVPYETDLEAARAMVPPMVEVEEPATALMTVLRIHSSSIGAFNEAQVTLRVRYQGEPRRFNVLMFTTSDASLTYGRELLGAPKKLGHVELLQEQEGYVGIVERPRGFRLVTCAVTPRTLIRPDPTAFNTSASLSLRVLPHPDDEQGKQRVTIELVETAAEWTLLDQWQGPAALTINASEIDPFHRLPVRRVLGGMYTRLNVTAPWPRTIARM